MQKGRVLEDPPFDALGPRLLRRVGCREFLASLPIEAAEFAPFNELELVQYCVRYLDPFPELPLLVPVRSRKEIARALRKEVPGNLALLERLAHAPFDLRFQNVAPLLPNFLDRCVPDVFELQPDGAGELIHLTVNGFGGSRVEILRALYRVVDEQQGEEEAEPYDHSQGPVEKGASADGSKAEGGRPVAVSLPSLPYLKSLEVLDGVRVLLPDGRLADTCHTLSSERRLSGLDYTIRKRLVQWSGFPKIASIPATKKIDAVFIKAQAWIMKNALINFL